LNKRPIYIYVQDPNALKTWLSASESKPEIIYNLESLDSKTNAKEHLLLLHETEEVNDQQVRKLAEMGWDILLFSNKPSVNQSIHFFKLGIKGYLNTFSSSERIKQAIETVQLGNVWLGQNLMNAMIQSIGDKNLGTDEWKKNLTEREIEVVSWVVKSKSNKEIGQLLDITERTVKAHLQNVFQKLNVKDRLSLVIKVQSWQA